jgi:microcystin-dependent protein
MAMIPMGVLPVGAVTAFAGALGAPVPATAHPPDSAPPSGPHVTAPVEAWCWMLCDGRALDVGQYPELFAALGYLYGGAVDTFNIPDYRGAFLRGTDYGAGRDPDVTQRTAAAGGAAYDQGVGSRQQSALLTHDHNYQSAPAMSGPTGEGAAASSPAQPAQSSAPADSTGTLLTPATGVSPYETRPANIAIHYLIKFSYGPWCGPGAGVWP